MRDACNGKNECSYHGTSAVAGNPCVGIDKFTVIHYSCVPGKYTLFLVPRKKNTISAYTWAYEPFFRFLGVKFVLYQCKIACFLAGLVLDSKI